LIELIALATVTSGLALAALIWFERRAKRAPLPGLAEEVTATVFLFDGEDLVDSTAGARALLTALPEGPHALARLVSHLGAHYPDLSERLAALPTSGALSLASPSKDKPLVLEARLIGGLTRIALIDPHHQPVPGDRMAMRALQDELDLLRETAEHAPVLIWRERPNGDVIWANKAYMSRAEEVLAAHQDLTWPLPQLFTEPPVQSPRGPRLKLNLRDGGASWYEVQTTGAPGEEQMHFATSVDSLVTAESSLRDFMVTLTKTFAHLHVGLAIFDSQRQLVLFNPALMDLTGLPVDFLTMRPSLISVLDGMRDRNMIPEPKDYRSWRRQMTEMERAASSGLYEETWSLPGGQTYRVIGRPHPNGALALMLEDISSEMIRTRRFREDLEISQSVLDQMDEAIAVFSPSGQLVMSNSAYTAIWGEDPGANMAEATLRSLSIGWRNRCAPTELWSDLEDFAAETGERYGWSAELRMTDGRLVATRCLPLSGGATMVGWRLPDAAVSPTAVVLKGGARKRA
jgi:PAS domain-containing protein